MVAISDASRNQRQVKSHPDSQAALICLYTVPGSTPYSAAARASATSSTYDSGLGAGRSSQERFMVISSGKHITLLKQISLSDNRNYPSIQKLYSFCIWGRYLVNTSNPSISARSRTINEKKGG